jgi:hypothetical protein
VFALSDDIETTEQLRCGVAAMIARGFWPRMLEQFVKEVRLRLAQMRASTVLEINHAAALRLLISVRAAANDYGILLSLSLLSRKLISPPTKMAKPEK